MPQCGICQRKRRTRRCRTSIPQARLRLEHGVALLFISHDLGVIHEVCDRVAVMRDGQIVETGPVAEVFRRPGHEYTRELLRALPRIGPASTVPTETETHARTN